MGGVALGGTHVELGLAVEGLAVGAVGPKIASVGVTWVLVGLDLGTEHVLGDGEIGSGGAAMEHFGTVFLRVAHEVDGEAVVGWFGELFRFLLFGHAVVVSVHQQSLSRRSGAVSVEEASDDFGFPQQVFFGKAGFYWFIRSLGGDLSSHLDVGSVSFRMLWRNP
jgi:hypothetical protein